MFMSAWLSPAELAKFRDTQNLCRHLNRNASVIKDGRKPFIVVSGRLMEFAAIGDLLLICSDASSSMFASGAAVVSPATFSSLSASTSIAACVSMTALLSLPRPASYTVFASSTLSTYTSQMTSSSSPVVPLLYTVSASSASTCTIQAVLSSLIATSSSVLAFTPGHVPSSQPKNALDRSQLAPSQRS